MYYIERFNDNQRVAIQSYLTLDEATKIYEHFVNLKDKPHNRMVITYNGNILMEYGSMYYVKLFNFHTELSCETHQDLEQAQIAFDDYSANAKNWYNRVELLKDKELITFWNRKFTQQQDVSSRYFNFPISIKAFLVGICANF
jgi:hypothetical protein